MIEKKLKIFFNTFNNFTYPGQRRRMKVIQIWEKMWLWSFQQFFWNICQLLWKVFLFIICWRIFWQFSCKFNIFFFNFLENLHFLDIFFLSKFYPIIFCFRFTNLSILLSVFKKISTWNWPKKAKYSSTLNSLALRQFSDHRIPLSTAEINQPVPKKSNLLLPYRTVPMAQATVHCERKN